MSRVLRVYDDAARVGQTTYRADGGGGGAIVSDEWKGSGGKRGKPETCWTLQLPWIVMLVHRHIHYEPDQWLLSCAQVATDNHELKAKNLGEAKAEAVAFVRERLSEYVKAVEDHIAGR